MKLPGIPDLKEQVEQAIREDVGSGDITAMLIPEEATSHARVITREPAVFCGQPWVKEVFRQLDPGVEISWYVDDGERAGEESILFALKGNSRSILTGERTALNFVQTLSATATRAAWYNSLVAGTGVTLLDTRKTIPGLRTAQKYAVVCGGCQNHRTGLFDAFLVKENHIRACGSISNAIIRARDIAPDKTLEIEVETFEELEEAIRGKADIIMLDNFSVEDCRQARRLAPQGIRLEASGGINEATLRDFAETGVDYISIGEITKSVRAIDLSMRFID